MATFTTPSLAEALAEASASRAPKLEKARGYSPALGAIYSPKDTVAHLTRCLEADGVAIVRTDYGFRTMTPAEKAERASALQMAAE